MTTNGQATMADWLKGEQPDPVEDTADMQAVGLTAIPARHRAPLCAPAHLYDGTQQVTEALPVSDQSSQQVTARIFSSLGHTGEDMVE